MVAVNNVSEPSAFSAESATVLVVAEAVADAVPVPMALSAETW